MIKEFLSKIDGQWQPTGREPILLQVIGSSALFLQTDYIRGTKDADILELRDLPKNVWNQLLLIAGKEHWLLGSRAPELRQYIENLHMVQRDYLLVQETPIDLPAWLEE